MFDLSDDTIPRGTIRVCMCLIPPSAFLPRSIDVIPSNLAQSLLGALLPIFPYVFALQVGRIRLSLRRQRCTPSSQMGRPPPPRRTNRWPVRSPFGPCQNTFFFVSTRTWKYDDAKTQDSHPDGDDDGITQLRLTRTCSLSLIGRLSQTSGRGDRIGHGQEDTDDHRGKGGSTGDPAVHVSQDTDGERLDGRGDVATFW